MMSFDNIKHLLGVICLAAVSFALSGCTPLIAEYNLEAYKNATSLKAETDNLVKLSGTSYSKHAAEIKSLSTKIDAAYEFSAGVPKNQASTTLWKEMRNPEGGLWGAFVPYWKSRGKLPQFAVDHNRKIIAAYYDLIICVEANKQKTASCTGSKSPSPERSAETISTPKKGKSGG
ncbi:hypothetical protein [Hansschlegelia beijingensis]|uniref:Uncharacterized protein n=1 Tax=Hansschlegelia beijingensis TaxID=1133344 RepID=A0A7W6CX94_9HYPH|nr:hypothetical protein [Hansschlegelia beijingensis]MBB3972805.1 hypothetical protein [Hansschlegelia beijingensis]